MPKPFLCTYFNFGCNIWSFKFFVNFLIHFYSPVTILICWPIYFFAGLKKQPRKTKFQWTLSQQLSSKFNRWNCTGCEPIKYLRLRFGFKIFQLFIKKNPTICNNALIFYYSIFIWSSTCFGRHTALHHEP